MDCQSDFNLGWNLHFMIVEWLMKFTEDNPLANQPELCTHVYGSWP